MRITGVPGARSLAAWPALAVAGVLATAVMGRPALPAGTVPAAAAVTKPVLSGLGGQDWSQIRTSGKIVALTFDGANADGVNSILSTLQADHIPATFMLTGAFASGFPGKANIGKLPPGMRAVGLAIDPTTGGYWILKSDGGVDNFNAPWYGSLAGKLAKGQAVTGIAGQ